MINYLQYLKLLVKLFILINPISLIPIFILSIDSIIEKDKKKFNICINLIMFLILLFTFLWGKYFLDILDVDINMLQITGGLLIILSTLNIILNESQDTNSSNEKKINKKYINYIKLLIPISFPLMAGPSSISMLIIYSNSCNSFLQYFFSIFFIMLFCFLCWLFFELISFFRYYISDFAILFFNKIFSIILFSYGIQMILLGIKNFFIL